MKSRAAPLPGDRIVIVSPIRDEEATLERTIRCLTSQTLPPVLWVAVDDGSTDRTPEILARAAASHPWIRVVRRQDRGYRELGGGVIDAFYAGLDAVDVDYDFLAKMDVDLEFGPHYLERIVDLFRSDPRLAAASGKVFRSEGDRLVEEFMIDEMVAGQFKLYRREAFERIGGFVGEVMWDGIDFHQASILHGRLRWGRGQWFMGSSLPYVIASGVFRMREKPYVVGGLLIIVASEKESPLSVEAQRSRGSSLRLGVHLAGPEKGFAANGARI
jgi:glycosyltransferase involved in cell wall biosynthesis